MRILIISQYFWPEDFRVNDLATELVGRSHEVTVLTGQPNYPNRSLFPDYGVVRPWRQTVDGVKIKRVPLASRGNGQGWRLALNFLSFAASASLLGPLRARGGYDVIFVYEPSPVTVGIPAVLLKRLTGAPIVFWVQDLWPETLAATGAVRSPAVLRLLARLVRWLYRASDRILVESEGFVSHALVNGAAPHKLSYLPNWAESSYQPVELSRDAAERDQVPKGFCVMFAGNLGISQSLETLLDAAEATRDQRDIHWVVLGDGRQRAWLAGQVAARGLSSTVHLLGRHPVEAMPRFFSLAQALLVTLKREPIYALTIPSKVQSYLACGRPIVGALDGEGARVIEESGAGVVGPAEDGQALADSVLVLYRMSAEERAAMGRNGHAYFTRNFERERLLDQLEETLLHTSREVRCVS